jgi:hypothetical protein
MTRFGVRGFPTVMFLDSQGNKVEDLRSRDAGPVRDQINSVIQAHSRPLVYEATMAEGLEAATREGKLLAVVFMDATGEDNAAFLDLVTGPTMEQVRGRFIWIKRPVTGERNRPTDEAKEHGVRKGPSVVVLDPWAEGEARELKKITSFRAFRRDLEKVLEDAQERGHPPAATPGETPPAPTTEGHGGH